MPEYAPEKESVSVEPKEKDGYLRDYISGKKIKWNPEEVEAVQVFSKMLVEDYGYDKEQIQTHPQFRVKTAPSGEEKYPVDITVFRTKEKRYDNVLMIIECKRSDRKEGRKQLDIYLNLVPSAEIGVWFNGKEHLFLRKVINKKTSTINWVETPDIPKNGQRIEDIGLYQRKDLEKTQNLKAVFNDIRNYLAGNATAITRDEPIAQEIMKLLFCKIYDEINAAPTDQVKFRVGINEDAEVVKRRIDGLFQKVKEEYSDVIDPTESIKLDSNSLVYVIGTLMKYEITTAERDVIGDAFEVFIGPALRGEEGQFFTPRNVVRTCIEMLDPKVGEYIIDPACGSGGFLIVALEHVWKKLEEEAKIKKWSETTLATKKRDAASRFFSGIDKDQFLSKVTKAYMALIGDGRGSIFCENSLLSPNEWHSQTQENIKLGKYDVVVTNPPFGAKIPVHGQTTLSQYDLAFVWKKSGSSWAKTSKLRDRQPPQILFIERCLQLLKPGGRLAIVLPEGLLGNMDDGYVRHFILENADVLGVIDCPTETFQPNTSTKTCILILRKKKESDVDYKIFMAIPKKCGHNRRGQAVAQDDFKVVTREWKRVFEEEKTDSEITFTIKSSSLEDGINFIPRRYSPNLHAEINKVKKFGVKTLTIGELLERGAIEIRKGDEVGSVNYSDDGVPFIRTGNIVNGVINRSPDHYVDEEIYAAYSKEQDLKPEDILVTTDGKIGIVGMIRDGDKCIISSGIISIRVLDKKLINPYFLFAVLGSKIVRNQAEARYVTAATLKHLHSDRLAQIEIPIPDKKVMTEIATEIDQAFKLKTQSENKLEKELDAISGKLVGK